MINVGVIGLGPVWESYRSEIGQLRRPPQITAIYDVVPARADQAAQDQSAGAVGGIQSLAQRSDVEAILLMDVNWLGVQTLNLLSRYQKPVFIASWLPADALTCCRWFEVTQKQGVTLMPAMWRRFMPATVRLKELIATELGAPHRITLPIEFSSNMSAMQIAESVLGWLDFVWHLIRREPVADCLQCLEVEGGPAQSLFNVKFPACSSQPTPKSRAIPGRECLLQLVLRGSVLGPQSHGLLQALRDAEHCQPEPRDCWFPPEMAVPRIELACERGLAAIESRTSLTWESMHSRSQTESLTSERSERVVMLDHFCRRAVGGLIPVADFNDVHRALKLVLNGSAGQ